MNHISVSKENEIKKEIKMILEEKEALMNNFEFLINSEEIEYCINEINNCDKKCLMLYQELKNMDYS